MVRWRDVGLGRKERHKIIYQYYVYIYYDFNVICNSSTNGLITIRHRDWKLRLVKEESHTNRRIPDIEHEV